MFNAIFVQQAVGFLGVVVNVYKVDTKIAFSLLKTSKQKVEVIAKISTNKLSTFDFFNLYFTTC
jgi:hypothetical protein